LPDWSADTNKTQKRKANGHVRPDNISDGLLMPSVVKNMPAQPVPINFFRNSVRLNLKICIRRGSKTAFSTLHYLLAIFRLQKNIVVAGIYYAEKVEDCCTWGSASHYRPG